MTEYDINTPREFIDKEGEVKTQWIKIGKAWDKDGSKYITGILNVLPTGKDPKIVLIPKDNDTSRQDNKGEPTNTILDK